MPVLVGAVAVAAPPVAPRPPSEEVQEAWRPHTFAALPWEGALPDALRVPPTAPWPVSGDVRARWRDSRGFRLATFTWNGWSVEVLLPDDVAAGDTVSGLITVRGPGPSTGASLPAGSGHALAGHVLKVNGRDTRVGAGVLVVHVPADARRVAIGLRSPWDEPVGVLEVPVARPASVPPSPPGCVAPAWCQSGGLLRLPGHFDGDLRTTRIQLAGDDLPLLAESPRRVLAGANDARTGRVPLQVSDGAWRCSAETFVLGLAHPRTLSVRCGEPVALTVTAHGLWQVPPTVQPVVILTTWVGEDSSEQRFDVRPEDAQHGRVELTASVTPTADGTLRATVRLEPAPLRESAAP